ncbi:MAG: hypothetical protein IKK24_00310 [Clostridia bacterium]|nr:hypothetical protein [Clostridia bacterium]
MDIFKILALCILTAVLAVMLKQYKPEYAVFTVVAAAIALILLILGYLIPAAQELKALLDDKGIDSIYFKTALKALGIAYVSEFAADACRDCGQTSMASKAEFAGKTAIFLISLPLLASILKTAVSFVGG